MSKNNKIKVERPEEPLSLEDQNKLIDRVLILTSMVAGYETFLKLNGKMGEAQVFMDKFMSTLTTDKLNKILEKENKEKK